MPRPRSFRLVSFRVRVSSLGVVAALAAAAVGVSSAGAAQADPGRGASAPEQAATGAYSGAARPDGIVVGRPSAARRAAAVDLPKRCRTAVTIARPDRSLALGVVEGDEGRLHPTGAALEFDPVAFAFVGASVNRGVTVDRYLATDEAGRLHTVRLTERAAAGGSAVSVTDTVIGRGWRGIRSFVVGGPYLYALTTSGGLKRYRVSSTLDVTVAGIVATTGWDDVVSLGYGGWWKLPKGEVADDLVGVTGSGRLTAYSVPRDDPDAVTSRVLLPRGWHVFSHVAVGTCLGASRPLVGIKPDGSVYAYLDADGNDQSGDDIRPAGLAATGWTGSIAD